MVVKTSFLAVFGEFADATKSRNAQNGTVTPTSRWTDCCEKENGFKPVSSCKSRICAAPTAVREAISSVVGAAACAAT